MSSLVRNAVAVAASTGAMSQEAAAAAQPAAEAYYGPVLRQLCTAALKLHLQVQGTTDTTFVFVPGGCPGPSKANIVDMCALSAKRVISKQGMRHHCYVCI